jgi:hypothetical protein
MDRIRWLRLTVSWHFSFKVGVVAMLKVSCSVLIVLAAVKPTEMCLQVMT